jgi:hypothetical protein
MDKSTGKEHPPPLYAVSDLRRVIVYYYTYFLDMAESLVLNPRVTLGFNIVESEGKPRVSANTLGFR